MAASLRIRREAARNTLEKAVSYSGKTRSFEQSIAAGAVSRFAGPHGEDAARGFLSSYGGAFGVQDQSQELSLLHETHTNEGLSFVRFQQFYQGVPVFGGELIVGLDSGQNIKSANGEVTPDLTLSTSSEIDSGTAVTAALDVTTQSHGVDAVSLTALPPELWIYDPSLIGPARLVWRTEVTPNEPALIRELVLVNAHDGSIALHFNQVDGLDNPAQLQDEIPTEAPTETATEDIVATETPTSTEIASETATATTEATETSTDAPPTDTVDPTATPTSTTETASASEVITDDTGAFEGSVVSSFSPLIQTYMANHGTGLPGTFLCNQSQPACTNGSNNDADKAHKYAFDTYNFYANNFGRDSLDNDGLTMISSVNYSVNYANAGWTGTQMLYGDGFAAADDVVGHELTHGVTQYESNLIYYYQPGAINEALSDIFGEYMDLTNYYTGSSDHGGVHTNSGIANKAAFLLADGGTFNGYTVTGLGVIKAAHIFYEAQMTLLTSGSDYGDLYNALYQACTNLAGGSTGITVFDCIEVCDATNATEMNLQPVSNFNTEAPLCATGQVPTNVFFDNLESGTGNWTFAAASGTNRWQLDAPASIGSFAHSGLHALYANDATVTPSDSSAAMTANVTLQANSYLHFAQAYSLETNGDGGVLEYSTNSGSSWADANSLLDNSVTNNGYDGTIPSSSDNPLKNRSTFTGVSHGYISSRYNLASLNTSNVRFRLRFGTDTGGSGGENHGWWVDDVRIYTCAVPAAATCYTLNTSLVSSGAVTLPPTNCSDGSARYSPGSAFTLTAVPAHGYYFTGWTGSYTSFDPAVPVTMSGNVSLTAGFAAFACPYTDIASSFARDAICEITARDVMAPATSTTFNTQGLIKRATMATFLAGAYAAATDTEATVVSVPFTDIGSLPTDVQDDIARIYGLGITTATTYAPSLNISGNQMGVFLARLYKAIHGSDASVVYVPFTDIWTVGEEWAQTGISRIYGLGITIGTTATTYTPYALVTREQMALFIVSLLRATGNQADTHLLIKAFAG